MKIFKDNENAEWFIVRAIVLAVMILFTYYGFIEKHPCDLDAIFPSCRLTPFTTLDLIGCVLFYLGCLILAGVPKWFGLEWFNPEGGSYYWIVFAYMVLGVILIWA